MLLLTCLYFFFKSHEEAKQFRFKVIPNWDDIVDLCTKDKATRLGVENALDTYDIMSKEATEDEVIHGVSIDIEGPSSTTRKTFTQVRVKRKKG